MVAGTCHRLDVSYSNNFTSVHKGAQTPWTPDCCGDQILYGGAQSSWGLRMELALRRHCNVYNVGVTPWFLANSKHPALHISLTAMLQQ